ncbi:MAG: magnesium transporter [Candidatus Thermoplasmatota archaeon]
MFYLLVIVEFAGGGALSTLSNAFETIPGLIVIIPALLGMRGNINGALAARLGSAWHLGLVDIKNIFNQEVRENLKASLILSAFIPLLIGLLSWLICSALKFVLDPFKVIVITFSAGILAGALMCAITILIVIVAVKLKVDPDNVTAPIVATLGDLFTILCLVGIVAVVARIW